MKLVDWAQLEVVFIPSCPSLLQDPPEKALRSLGAFQSLGWGSGNSGTPRVSLSNNSLALFVDAWAACMESTQLDQGPLGCELVSLVLGWIGGSSGCQLT